MPDIFPATDQLIADITKTLDELEVEYTLDYTYDARPYLRVSDEGHEKWKGTQPETPAEPADESPVTPPADPAEEKPVKTQTSAGTQKQDDKTVNKRR